MSGDKEILISIVIVNYKVPACLVEALRSLRLAELYDRSEVIIVDNASGDGSREIITSQFHEVQWIQLKDNIGFGKACNIGVSSARGEYLLLLNPDTAIASNTLSSAVEFMKSHPKAGLMGPKILNPDGTLQLSCRRSIPTPSVAFYYFTGLSGLFPKSKRFGQYHLTYMDEDEAAQVDVISGSFMFMRRKLFNDINGFDKRFFMYGEDIDLCYRISQMGYEVWYYPQIKIVHQKGKSSSKRRIRSRFYFYEAMIIFSRKYRGIQETYFPWWLMWIGIVFQATLNIGGIIASAAAAVILDLAVINSALWVWLSRTAELSPYGTDTLRTIIHMHLPASAAIVAMFLYNGIYSAQYYSIKNAFLSGILSSAVLMSWVYFMTDYPLTPVGTALGIAVVLSILWREALPFALKGITGRIFAPETMLIIGHGGDIPQYIKKLKNRRASRISGIITLGTAETGGQIEGYPVLGGINDLAQTLADGKIHTLVIATAQPWYSDIINILVGYKKKGLDIKWEAMDL